jgi:hypothetical protein
MVRVVRRFMRKVMGKKITIVLGVVAGWALLAALTLPRAASAQDLASNSGLKQGQESVQPACADCAIVREIDDPTTGQHWILMRDPRHPGGPGVLVAEESIADHGRVEGAIVQLRPVIRAGDRLIVEQSSAKVNSRLEGVALSPAALGASLRVRLGVTGKAVQAVALGPGRAVLIPEKGLWQ